MEKVYRTNTKRKKSWHSLLSLRRKVLTGKEGGFITIKTSIYQKIITIINVGEPNYCIPKHKNQKFTEVNEEN